MRTVIWILAVWVAGLGGYLLYEAFWPGATGKLVVTADAEAEVWLDLQPTGKAANGTVFQLPRGKHSVTARAEGFDCEPFVQVVEIRPGRTDSARFKMVRSAEARAGRGRDVLSSGQTDVDGKMQPVPPQMPSIEQRVESEMPWDVPRTAPRSVDSAAFPVTSTQTETRLDSITYSRPDTSARQSTKDKIKGSLEVSSSVPGATIFVNDRPQEKKTPATLTMDGGIYTIRAELEGYACSPSEQTVRISRGSSSQHVFFTLIEAAKARREFRVVTEPVAGEIYVDSVLAGTGEATIPHEFGVFQIQFGDVEGYVAPEPVRLTVTPSNPNPEVKGVYMQALSFSIQCSAEDQVASEGEIKYEVGIYLKGDAPKVSTTHGPKVKEIPGSQKFGWELAMGDPNRNPTGGDYVEFIFELPQNVPPSLPLNLRLYLYRSNKKYPLSLSGRSEITVLVNGRIFLDNYRPRYGTEEIEMDRFEEWSLQHTLVPGENRIMIRSGQNNQIFNYLWKVEIN